MRSGSLRSKRISLIVSMMMSASVAMRTSVTLLICSGGMTSILVLSFLIPVAWSSCHDRASAFPMVVLAL